jgi:hypothetical protein
MVARRRNGPFIATLEHRRFVEFANAVRRYIGLCFGAAGVGKTLSARRYANWDNANPTALMSYRASKAAARRIDAALVASRTVFYTPSVSVTPATLRRDLNALLTTANTSIGLNLGQNPDTDQDHIELVIIDEADRLSHAALECARDLFDRADFGLILIRHARHRKANGTISSVLQPRRFRPSLPPATGEGSIIRYSAPLPKGLLRCGRRHAECQSHRDHRTNHRWKFSAAPSPARSDRASSEDQ